MDNLRCHWVLTTTVQEDLQTQFRRGTAGCGLEQLSVYANVGVRGIGFRTELSSCQMTRKTCSQMDGNIVAARFTVTSPENSRRVLCPGFWRRPQAHAACQKYSRAARLFSCWLLASTDGMHLEQRPARGSTEASTFSQSRLPSKATSLQVCLAALEAAMQRLSCSQLTSN